MNWSDEVEELSEVEFTHHVETAEKSMFVIYLVVSSGSGGRVHA